MKTITNWRQALIDATFDPAVGIAHSVLSGTADFRLHVAVLKTDKRVAAHVHFDGDELYIIQTGSGLLYTGFIDARQTVNWDTPIPVKEGDTFVIAPGEVHQLHNTGSADLSLVFGCPDTHLAADRLIVPDYSFA
jgi:mannose-6-phosphate isomerase-like protein (cupin superfamily)